MRVAAFVLHFLSMAGLWGLSSFMAYQGKWLHCAAFFVAAAISARRAGVTLAGLK